MRSWLAVRRTMVSWLHIPLAPLTAAFVLVSVSTLAPAAGAVDITDTRLLSEPAVSADHVAFAYAGDLWVVGREGGTARRLTTFPAREGQPRFSPDGRSIAFTGYYDGNVDVFVVPTEGGVPERLTWHPDIDVAQGFTPDGSAVLFTSPRSVYTRRYQQLFTVPVEGGFPHRLPIPHAFKASYSPDGSKIAYVPLREAFTQWKHYRGGTASRIWLYDTGDHSVEQIPQPEGRCNDTDPMWMGDTVYFLSDRNGEFNLFTYDTATREVRQLTAHENFPILDASHGGGVIVYQQAGWLHLFDPAAATSERLTIGVAADLPETRPRFETGGDFIRNAHVSPSGARAVFEFRGEIVTVPAEKGDHRNLTGSTGAHERSPAWSPDGRSIAYVSDAADDQGRREYALSIAPQDGRGEVRRLALEGAGFYEDLEWSPDGAKISFTDNSWAVYILDVESGEVTRIDQEIQYGPVKTLYHAWSPDSRWLAYTKNTATYLQQVHLYSLDDGSTHVLTDGLADVGEPVFDAGGKYLWMTASTDAGPVRQWFAMSNADMEITSALYLAVLPEGEPSPLAAESDEETGEKADEKDKDAKSESDGDTKDAGKKTGKDAGENGAMDKGSAEAEDEAQEVRVEVGFEDLDQRIVAVPLEPAHYTNLQAGPKSRLYYLRREGGQRLFGGGPPGSLRRFDLDKREEETLLDGVDGFVLSKDGKKILYVRRGSWHIVDAGGKIEPGKGKIPADEIEVKIDPREEWAQIFDEAWRINRDYFYDPNMHGADWPAMKEKYSGFLPHLADREDLNDVLRWMSSELAVGHHRVGGGDTLWETEEIDGGLLGADYEIDQGRYRFAKVYGGLNWNPDLRSPLTEPGVDVKPGEYLLAVAGEELRAPENLFARFENTAGKIVDITVGPNADGSGSRTVQVVPVDDESDLRNRDWVEGNLAKVTEATGGRVAYVHVPNTTRLGHVYFKRYFFPQANRDAIIVDERHNGGGQVADYYIDILRRPYISHWATRYGRDLETPLASIQGPKVMLIDETAGSGGDLLPWMFRKLGLGTLVGRRTWGGLVGILGFPTLMDGGGITAPNLAIWTEDGFVVEGVGVPPDVEVEQWPKDVIEGRDPQLDKAIEIALEQLEAHPPKEHRKPPYPVKARP